MQVDGDSLGDHHRLEIELAPRGALGRGLSGPSRPILRGLVRVDPALPLRQARPAPGALGLVRRTASACTARSRSSV